MRISIQRISIHPYIDEIKLSVQNQKGGSTVLFALVRGHRLWMAWAGDSQAFLLRSGQPLTIMRPHKPDSPDERKRIEKEGGCVLWLGSLLYFTNRSSGYSCSGPQVYYSFRVIINLEIFRCLESEWGLDCFASHRRFRSQTCDDSGARNQLFGLPV